MQWLRDGIKPISSAADSLGTCRKTGADQPVYSQPAFTGLGPHLGPESPWRHRRPTRDTGIQEIVTAGLQSVGYQTRDLLEAMKADGVKELAVLRVDGGMVVNDWVVNSWPIF